MQVFIFLFSPAHAFTPLRGCQLNFLFFYIAICPVEVTRQRKRPTAKPNHGAQWESRCIHHLYYTTFSGKNQHLFTPRSVLPAPTFFIFHRQSKIPPLRIRTEIGQAAFLMYIYYITNRPKCQACSLIFYFFNTPTNSPTNSPNCRPRQNGFLFFNYPYTTKDRPKEYPSDGFFNLIYHLIYWSDMQLYYTTHQGISQWIFYYFFTSRYRIFSCRDLLFFLR